MSALIETDARRGTTPDGQANQRWLLCENTDGSTAAQAGRAVANAQLEYDGDHGLQALLTAADQSRTVRRSRRPSSPAR